MVDAELAPGGVPGKMQLSHKFPRCGVDARDRLLAALDRGCQCGARSATMRRRLIAEKVTVHVQCDGCGRPLDGALPRSEFYFWQDFTEWNPAIRDAYNFTEREQWERREAERQEAWRARREEYSAWLTACSGWQELRERVVARAAAKCEACLKASPQHVHHTSYERGKLPPAWELRAVCAECHRRLHDGWRQDYLDAAE